MPLSAEPNFDSLELAHQIIDLNTEVYREVKAERYERAAALRDQREALKRRLNDLGDPTVAQNVRAALRSGPVRGAPILGLLEKVESAIDPELLGLLSSARLPPRWLIHDFRGSCRASVAKRLNADSLESPYFHAQLPVFGSATLNRATRPMEWLTAAIHETARSSLPVVWIVEEPTHLAERGLLDTVLQFLRMPSTQFVACLRTTDATLAPRFAEIPSASAMRA